MESFRVVSSVNPLIEHDMPWVMTIPTSIPWSMPCYTDAQMTFTAKSVESNTPPVFVTSQMKRKGSHLDNDPLPSKIYISEEKMIARMKELNINTNCAATSSQAQQPVIPDLSDCQSSESNIILDDVDSGFIDMDDFASTSDAKEPILVLSEEIRNSIANPDPILPSKILEKIQKPSMELVLWKPPGGIVSSLIKAKSLSNKNIQQYRTNNNNDKEQPVLKARKTLTSRDDKNTENISEIPSLLSTSSSFSHLYEDTSARSQKDMEEMDL